MKKILNVGIGLAMLMLGACGQSQNDAGLSESSLAVANEASTDVNHVASTQENQVIKAIMARRSVRKYKSVAIEAEKLDQILTCGINAPNGMYKQSWELRVVNTPEVMEAFEKAYTTYQVKNGKKRINHPSFGAPCLVFIAHDTTYDLSQVDCGLLGENIILAAQSMNLGTCCLGGVARFINTPEAADLLKRLDLPASYKLLYAIAIGYPDEGPAAKSRSRDKIKFIK